MTTPPTHDPRPPTRPDAGTIAAASPGTAHLGPIGRATEADTLAAVVLAVPGVAALHAGMFGEVGTYLPGRRVVGIRLSPDLVDVHIVMSYGAAVDDVAARIRTAVADVTGPRAIHIHIEDVLPGLDTAPYPSGKLPTGERPSAATRTDV